VIYERIPPCSGRIKRGGSTASSSMDFVSAVLSLSQEHDAKGNADSTRAGGLAVEACRGGREQARARLKRASERVRRGEEARERQRNGRTRRGEKGRALEETKGVFSSRWRIQMERSGLFSSRSAGNLPTYLPTYLYVRGLRGLMSPGTLPKIEWLTRANTFAPCRL